MNPYDPVANARPSRSSIFIARLWLVPPSVLFGLGFTSLLRAWIDSLTSCRLLTPRSGPCEPETAFFSWIAIIGVILGTSYCLAWATSGLSFLQAFKARAALKGALFQQIATGFAVLGLGLYFFWAAVELSYPHSLFLLACIGMAWYILKIE